MRRAAEKCSVAIQKKEPVARERNGLVFDRKRSALQRRDVLHGLQRLRDVLFGRDAADRGRDLAVLRHDERRALGEAVVDRDAARVLHAGAAFAHLS